MSTSKLPRLYFDGHFSWNPSTYNNDDYADNGLTPWDAESNAPNWLWLETQLYKGEPVTRANFREWSYAQQFPLFDDNDPSQPGGELAPAEWNLFGGMECGFVTKDAPVLEMPDVFSKPRGTAITGVTDSDCVYNQSDAAVGLELQFNVAPPTGPFAASAKLIDINPKSPFSSQVIADDFRLGDGTNGFSAPVSQRMHSRWLNFSRNLNQDGGLMIAGIASTVMQTGLRSEDINWEGSSPALEQLHAASLADDAAGVMLRIVADNTLYFNGELFGPETDNQFPGMLQMRQLYMNYFEELDLFERGLAAEPPPVPCNRAYSRIVGWLGVWNKDEFVTVPGGRHLLAANAPGQPAGSPTPEQLYPQNVITVRPPKSPATGYNFAPATVERDDGFTRLTVDLCCANPQLDSTGTFADFGNLDLGIMIDGTYQRLCKVAPSLGFLPDFLKSAGLVDIATSTLNLVNGQALTKEQFDSNPLVLQAMSSTPNDQPVGQWPWVVANALAENPLVAETNTRGMYVDEPGDDPGPTTEFTVDVRAYGAVPTEQVGLVVAQYSEEFAVLAGDTRVLELFYQTPSGTWIGIDNDTIVDASSGTVTVGMRGMATAVDGALPHLFFFPVDHSLIAAAGETLTPDQPIVSQNVIELPTRNALPIPPAWPYAVIRLLPYKSAELAEFKRFLGGNPEVEEVNQWVFEHVYETFHLMYPVMDFINTPQKFQQWRGRILAVTDPAHFFTSAYMPPTRTLTSAQREILVEYDNYLAGVHASGSPLRVRLPEGEMLRRS